jgi:hypothetical protein
MRASSYAAPQLRRTAALARRSLGEGGSRANVFRRPLRILCVLCAKSVSVSLVTDRNC